MIIDFKASGVEFLDQILNSMFSKSIMANVTNICREVLLNESRYGEIDTQTMVDFISVAKQIELSEENISKFITLFEQNPDFKK